MARPRPCTDCYAVSVSNPTPRPAAHWDASAIETIVPDTHGQQKEWSLHVGDSFTDVPTTNAFYRFIETLLHHGVTGGCSGDPVLPGQLDDARADGRLRAGREGRHRTTRPPACTTPMFADVPASSPFCRWIEELARRTVVTGCGGGNYCPSSPVSREQMAVFVAAHAGPGAHAAGLHDADLHRRARDAARSAAGSRS